MSYRSDFTLNFRQLVLNHYIMNINDTALLIICIPVVLVVNSGLVVVTVVPVVAVVLDVNSGDVVVTVVSSIQEVNYIHSFTSII